MTKFFQRFKKPYYGGILATFGPNIKNVPRKKGSVSF